MQTNDFSRLCGLSVCAFVRLCVIDVDFQSSNEPIFKIENGNNEVAVMMIVPGGVPPPSVPSYSIPFSRTSIFVVVVVVVVFIQKKNRALFTLPFLCVSFFSVVVVVIALNQHFIGIVLLIFFLVVSALF